MKVEALENRPVLSNWVIEYWEAFQTLGSSRIPHQGAIGPIPLTEISAYMDVVYLRNVDERLRMVRMIQSLDKDYCKHVNDKAAYRRDLEAKLRKSAPRKR